MIDNKIIEFSNDFDDKFNNTYRTKGGKYEKNYYRFISYIPNIVYEEYLRSLLIEFENKTAEKLQINESEKENIINQVQCINAIFENANKNKCDEIKKFLEESEVGSNLSEEGLCFDNWLNITKAKAEEIIIKLLKVRNDNRLCEIENEIKKEIKDDLKEKVLINVSGRYLCRVCKDNRWYHADRSMCFFVFICMYQIWYFAGSVKSALQCST